MPFLYAHVSVVGAVAPLQLLLQLELQLLVLLHQRVVVGALHIVLHEGEGGLVELLLGVLRQQGAVLAAQAEKKFMEVQQAYEEIMHRRQGGGQRAGSGYNGGAQQQRQPQYDDPFASFWGAYGGNPYGNAGYGGYGQTRQDDSIEMRAAKNYIDTGHYAEALNALGSVPAGKRNARWYFLSALAQSGLHNNAQAMEYARQAASMEPGNMQYQQLLSQLQGGGSWYSQQGQEYGRRTGSMNSVCTTILMLNLCCACCGGGRMMYYPMFCCI